MANPSIVSKTGTGTSAWIPVDYTQADFGIGFGCVVSGTVTYDVQHTFDNIQDTSVTPTAFTHSTVSSETTNQRTDPELLCFRYRGAAIERNLFTIALQRLPDFGL